MIRTSRFSARGRDTRFFAGRSGNDALRSSNVSRWALGLGAAGLVLSSTGVASAQALGGQIPFPSQNVAAGLTTGALTTHELRQLYLDWRDAVVEQCPEQGDARVRYPETNNDTRSEGIGYGMVIAAYMGDQATFDGLWGYYQRFSSNGLMHWKRNDCAGNGGGGDNDGSASDADIDAALALIVADRQFPGNGYAQDANQLLGAIRAELFNAGCQGVLMAGSQFGDCNCINPSYIPPAYYVAYGDVEEPAFWTQARDASYSYFNVTRDDNTGLVPAWSQSDGDLDIGCGPQVAGGGGPNEYQADAARTPWRVAMDYQWTGDPRARDFLTSIGGFASGENLMRIRDRYTLAGLPANPDELASHDLGRNTYVMGGFATAMVALSQEQLDDFTGAWFSVYKPGDNYEGGPNGIFRAFNNSLALLYGLVVTGTMWNPSGAPPTAVTEPALAPPTPGNVIVNGDFDEGMTGWSAFSEHYDRSAEVFTSSDGFALHQNGEMRLRVVRSEPAAPERLSLRQAVSLPPGRYRLALDARSAAAARPFQVSLREGEGENVRTIAAIVIGANETFTVDPEARTFQSVFEVATQAQAELFLEFGHSSEDVIVDNVVLEPTELPVDPGGAVGGPAPAPATPGAPGGGTPAAAPGDGTVGTVAPVGDAPGSAGVPAGQPGGLTPGQAPSAQPGNPSAPSAQNCAPAGYSVELNLCYDLSNGNVWDPSQGTYTRPPQHPGCGADERNPGQYYYWWPLLPACYDPASGTAFDPARGEWVFVGTNFTMGQRGTPEDSGCTVSPAGAGRSSWSPLALLGLVGAVVSLRRRR